MRSTKTKNSRVTTMPSYPVTEQKQQELQKRMDELEVRESDLEESFTRAGGSGGQKINKTSVMVRIRHKPTGLEVRCQQSRSQALNRFIARQRLLEKIDAQIKGAQSAEQKRIEKIRRQKRKRSKRAKEKMLEDKRRQSEKKTLRKKPSPYGKV